MRDVESVWKTGSTEVNMAIASPTDAERVALKRIASLRAGLFLPLFVGLGEILLATQIRNELFALIAGGSGGLIVVGLGVYVSFGLRCPRCRSWIPMPSNRSRCTSCGLGLEAASE